MKKQKTNKAFARKLRSHKKAGAVMTMSNGAVKFNILNDAKPPMSSTVFEFSHTLPKYWDPKKLKT